MAGQLGRTTDDDGSPWIPFYAVADCDQPLLGAYSPLGRGFLTGQISSRDDLPQDDWRRNDQRWSEENFAANLEIVEVIRSVAERNNASLAQVALVWLLAQGDQVVPIPGVKRIATLVDSAQAAELDLPLEQIVQISAAVPRGMAKGPRNGEAGMRLVRL